MNIRHNSRGFTLVEVTIILLVLTILSSIMLPQLGNFNRLARFVKTREDLGAICSVMKKMLDEVMSNAFYLDPRPNGHSRDVVGLLVGPGELPMYGSKEDGNSGIRGDQGHWLLEEGDWFKVSTDNHDHPESNWFYVDAFENHLQQNNPGNMSGHRSRVVGYKNPLDNPERGMSGAFFGWRGPYLDEFTSDPWGNRYMANVFALFKGPESESGNDIYSTAVVCYSAGIDEGIDTVFNQPMDDADGDGFYGWQFMDDDLGVILNAGGPF